MSNLYFIPRQTDRSVVGFFGDLADEFDIDTAHLQLKGSISREISLHDESDDFRDRVIQMDGENIALAQLIVKGVRVTYYREGVANFENRAYEESPYFDHIVLQASQQQVEATEDDWLQIIELITHAFPSVRPDSGLSLEPAARQLEVLHNNVLQRLESSALDVIEKLTSARLTLDEAHSERERKLEDEFAKRSEKLAQEWQARSDALDQERQALEAREAELDVRDNTTARRAIRRELLEAIKARQTSFQLTQDTRQKRRPIGFAMTLLALFFLAGVIITGSGFFKPGFDASSYDGLWLITKQTLFSIGFVTTMIYWIRWMNRWFEQHSESEFKLKQFELDIERANWLVETALEWREEQGSAIPDELLRSLSTGLFADKGDTEALVHPADQLASALFGSARAVRIKAGPDGAEVELDPKKLQKSKPIEATG